MFGGIIQSIGDLMIVSMSKVTINCLRAIKLTSLYSLRLYGILYMIPLTRNCVIQFMPYI